MSQLEDKRFNVESKFVNNKTGCSLFGFFLTFLVSLPLMAESNVGLDKTTPPHSMKAKVSFPETPEVVKYSLTFIINSVKTKLKSTEPYFIVPVNATIVRLSAVRKNGTLARQYALKPLQDQLDAARKQSETPVVKDLPPELPISTEASKPVETTVDPLDEKVLSGYENKATSSEKTSTDKLETELTEEFKRGKLLVKLGAELEQIKLNSTLGNQTLSGTSSGIAPTYELRQFFSRGEVEYSLGFGGRTTKITLDQPVEKTSSGYSEFYLASSLSMSPQVSLDTYFSWLKTPELSQVIKEIDDVEHGLISSSSHFGLTIGARYQWIDKLESGIRLTPYVSAGGGLGYHIFTNYEFLEYQKIFLTLGAYYKDLKLSRKDQCNACTSGNATKMSQVGLSLQASTTL